MLTDAADAGATIYAGKSVSLERNNQTLRPAQCSLRKVSVPQFYLDRDRIRSRTPRAFKNIFTNLNSRSSVPSSSGVTTPFLGILPCVIRWVTAVHVYAVVRAIAVACSRGS